MADFMILTCPGCNMVFVIEPLLTDEEGSFPLPAFCPFCGHSELEEGVQDFTEEKWVPTSVGRPKLTLILGQAESEDSPSKEGVLDPNRNG